MCVAPGCDRPAETRLGACVMHYKRFMRNGSFERVIASYEEDDCCTNCGDAGKLRKGLCNACRVRYSRKGHFGKEIAVAGTGTLSTQGYWLVTVNGKRELLHRIVAERELGRKLTASEVVHHIDGDKLNNDPSNLQVFPSQAAHMAHHRAAEKADE